MHGHIRLLGAIATVAVIVSPAMAATHTVEIADLQLGHLQVIDLGVQFSGITEVTLRAVGVGGRGLYECVAPAEGGWRDLDLGICLGNGCIEFSTVQDVPYDVTQTAVSTDGGWQACEGVTQCPVHLLAEPRGIVNYDWRLYCGLVQADLPPVSRLVITITADSVVAAERRSWGALKALYRH